MNKQTLQSVIETLEYAKRVIGDENEVLMKPIDKSIQDLRQVLAQSEQEPVGYVSDSGNIAVIAAGIDLDDDTPVYAAPPKREPLMTKYVIDLWDEYGVDPIKFAREIEAAHGIKENT